MHKIQKTNYAALEIAAGVCCSGEIWAPRFALNPCIDTTSPAKMLNMFDWNTDKRWKINKTIKDEYDLNTKKRQAIVKKIEIVRRDTRAIVNMKWETFGIGKSLGWIAITKN